MIQVRPDKEAFERICNQMEKGHIITCRDVADILGWQVIELFLMLSMGNNEGLAEEVRQLMLDVRSELKTGISHT